MNATSHKGLRQRTKKLLIILNPALRVLKVALILWGLIALIPIVLAFTSYPGKIHGWFAKDPARLTNAPEYIVLLGGAGIPSESGLIRTYYAAEQARKHLAAVVIVALPSDPNNQDSDSVRMRNELEMRGVSSDRIRFELRGRNTREQALEVARLLGNQFADSPVLVVTSPFHMKRALLTFRKVGFRNVGGASAFQTMQPVELRYRGKDLGGCRNPVVPDVGGNTFVRYGVSNNLAHEVSFLSEFLALLYYWGRGWI